MISVGQSYCFVSSTAGIPLSSFGILVSFVVRQTRRILALPMVHLMKAPKDNTMTKVQYHELERLVLLYFGIIIIRSTQ